MTPDEILAKERELEDRAKTLDDREASLTQQLAAINSPNADALSPVVGSTPTQNPNLAETNTTSLATYATSIKIHVPITLSLNNGNYTS